MSMAVQQPSVNQQARSRRGLIRAALGGHVLPGLLSVGVILALWQAAVVVFQVKPFVLPTPTAIGYRVFTDISSGLILTSLGVTVLEVLLGFFVAAVFGFVTGAAIALSPLASKTLYPCLHALQTVPKVAIAPLLIIWFGFGLFSKVITAALIAFFPVLVNVIAGLQEVDPQRLMLMRALRATPRQTFLKVRLPAMLPYLFAGLEIALTFSIIGVVVAEFIGSTLGLGVMIIQRQGTVDVAGVFSILIYLSLLGLFLSFCLSMVRKRVIYW